MYAAFPAYLHLNASLGGKRLAPLLELQDDLSGQAYATQDIGTSFNMRLVHGPLTRRARARLLPTTVVPRLSDPVVGEERDVVPNTIPVTYVPQPKYPPRAPRY